jgi:hypothetical protein
VSYNYSVVIPQVDTIRRVRHVFRGSHANVHEPAFFFRFFHDSVHMCG